CPGTRLDPFPRLVVRSTLPPLPRRRLPHRDPVAETVLTVPGASPTAAPVRGSAVPSPAFPSCHEQDASGTTRKPAVRGSRPLPAREEQGLGTEGPASSAALFWSARAPGF